MNKVVVRVVFTLLCIIGAQNVMSGHHGKGEQSAPRRPGTSSLQERRGRREGADALEDLLS